MSIRTAIKKNRIVKVITIPGKVINFVTEEIYEVDGIILTKPEFDELYRVIMPDKCQNGTATPSKLVL